MKSDTLIDMDKRIKIYCSLGIMNHKICLVLTVSPWICVFCFIFFREFLVLAPRTVRPMQTYEMHVTLFRLYYNDVTVRAVLSNSDVEYATSQVLFNDKGTKRIQLMVSCTDMSVGFTCMQ